jgi:aminopeptidase-like protein
VPWRRGAGNDETVWEAPGYEVPFVELTRFYTEGTTTYPTYHSSEDTAASMDLEYLDEIFTLMQHVIFILEHNAVIRRHFNGLICLSNPENNLYIERPDPAVVKDINLETERWGVLQDSLLRYFDGEHTILDIAEKHGVRFEDLFAYLRRFEEKGWITLEFQPITRATNTTEGV